MNFENKSTFINSIYGLIRAVKRVPHTAWVLLINFAVAATAIHLYLSNQLIPATIESKFYGSYYIAIIKTGMYFHFISSTYALTGLIVRSIVNRVHYKGSDVFILKLFYCIRQSSAIIMMLIHLSRFMPRSGYAPITANATSEYLSNYLFEEKQ